jgi:hemoglobin-like flavoprotein
MSPLLSDRTRQIFSQSLPLFRARKHEVIDRMQACLALAEPDQKAGQSAINTVILVEMLVHQAGHLLRTGKFDDLAHIPGEHAELGITGRTYSRFGDFLVPILKDVLGPNTPSMVPGLWCDTFWRIIRTARSAQPVLEAA